MPVLAVAALSARMMAEAAAGDGFTVIALDLFGDQDTRRASAEWRSIGDCTAMRIDEPQVLYALRELAARGEVVGWVAGGGFEGLPGLLEQGAAVLPLLGTAPQAVRRVRDPAEFFGFLDAQRMPYPAIQRRPPQDSTGWLLKNARGCGGWHIQRALPPCGDTVPPHHYFQHEMAGTPMSATFIANGRDAVVLGFNQLIVRGIGPRPFVYGGAVGPVPLPPGAVSCLSSLVRGLAAEFSLRGLGSVDFLRDGDQLSVLELNPRPPASLFVYAHSLPQGVMNAHLRACLHGELPPAAKTPAGAAAGTVRGLETVFARRPLLLSAPAARQLAARPGVHDLPGAASAFEAGHPVCSVSAAGASAVQVKARLEAARNALLDDLEMNS
jgi:predicted ATP-grasp superfamily ATP-dependent carboligase